MRGIIHSPADWRGPQMAASQDWVHRFTGAELAEVDAALRHARAAGLDFGSVDAAGFPLPGLRPLFDRLLDMLENGPGLFLLRGFPVERYSRADLRFIYWGMCKHLGTAMSQSKGGDVIGDVRDLKVDVNSPQGRAYTSSQKLTFHSDQADVVVLFVLQTAKAGGLSHIASALAIRNEIARTRPDLLEVIYQPFHWSWQQQEPPGGLPWYAQPVYTERDGHFSSYYIRTHIRSAQRFPEVPRLTAMQEEALDLVDSLAASPEFSFSMMFQPGDIQFLNNHVTLHSRTAFEDHPEPERRRHLLRMWLSVPNSRPLDPAMGTLFTDQRPGAVRGGFPSRTGTYVYETAGGAG